MYPMGSVLTIEADMHQVLHVAARPPPHQPGVESILDVVLPIQPDGFGATVDQLT